jgi:hypothetical protein
MAFHVEYSEGDSEDFPRLALYIFLSSFELALIVSARNHAFEFQ